jgi:3-hydroxyisobutyrate dehydrogenase-like beta-hydroxyacid dehydrogenase
MMANPTIGLLHPGEMGSMVGAAARANGLRVLWASEGRSAPTRERAAAAGVEDAKSIGLLIAASQVIVSVCPPHAAADLAREVAGRGFAGTYVDANAISPETAREIGGIIERGGATFLDGGIIGPPPRVPGSTRLYLSGTRAGVIASLFARGPLEAIVIDGGPGAASALKMAYAAYTKGTAALLMAIRALAAQAGVDDALLREWERSQPQLAAQAERAVRSNTPKAWRFVGEMEEMAATFERSGLPGGFAQAAAEIYRRLAPYKDSPVPPPLADVLKALIEQDRA